MNTELKNRISNLPRKPGVYQHKDSHGSVLYVGKAKDLRNRVRSYFQLSRPAEGRLRMMLSKVADVEVIVTDSEAEALILENNLIKKFRPRYNVNLRDDKTYPYICIKNERFPRIFPTRNLKNDGSKYFGPYTDVGNIRQVLKTVRSIFKLRSCSLHLSEKNIQAEKFEPCLDYYIEKCAAPCVAKQSEEEYNRTIARVEKLLNGHTGELIRQLRNEMETAAEETRFEEAAGKRDQIRALEKYSARQKMVSQDQFDRDLFALSVSADEKVAVGVLFKVREGKIIGRQHKYMKRIEGTPRSELMQRFVEAYYAETTFHPDEIFLAEDMADPVPLAELLRLSKGKRVNIHVPRRGEKSELMRMIMANADLLLQEYVLQAAKKEDERIPRSVKSLQRDLRLERLPRRIECFDVSHLGGTETVASCVVFEDGVPRKSEYRKYKIRSVDKPDDFQSMREVIARRYRRLNEEKGKLPDLVVIDGGKGQLSAAVTAMKEAEVFGSVPVIGLAKRLEEIYVPADPAPIHIPKTSSSLRLLQRARDEAHRFAIGYQRQRRKTTLKSSLTDVKGIGEMTARKLLKHFGSVTKLRAAPPDELANLVGPSVAERILTHLSGHEPLSGANGAEDSD